MTIRWVPNHSVQNQSVQNCSARSCLIRNRSSVVLQILSYPLQCLILHVAFRLMNSLSVESAKLFNMVTGTSCRTFCLLLADSGLAALNLRLRFNGVSGMGRSSPEDEVSRCCFCPAGERDLRRLYCGLSQDGTWCHKEQNIGSRHHNVTIKFIV